MTTNTYSIDDGDGNLICSGLAEHEARAKAQRAANRQRETVYLYTGTERPVAVKPQWVTWGPVRGLGQVRATEGEALDDLDADREGCDAQGGYSDRDAYQIDEDGYVVDEDGENVYPHGRTSPALRID